MGGSLADLPTDRIDQLELPGNKICHDNQFSPTKEKIDGSQPDFSTSLLDQSELTEKPNNFRQGFYSAAESQPVEVEVSAFEFESYTPLSKPPVVADLGQENVGQQHSATTHTQKENRYQRTQPQFPKNLDGSDRLPWDTNKRGIFDPEFEKHMARSLMQYPAYRDLMAGELMTKVRKHISAGRYDLKRRDELLIEWEAMQSSDNASDKQNASSTLTAKGAARRAKIARALSMEMP